MNFRLQLPLCDQVVTVYRKVGQQILRQVVDGCFYHWQDGYGGGENTPCTVRKFLLVLPQNAVQIGDRIFPGEGPVSVDWQQFVPAAVEGLSQVGYVKHYPTHTEAGAKLPDRS